MYNLNEARIIRESSYGYHLIPIQDEMLSHREVELVGEVDANTVNTLIRQLRYLQCEDPEAPITLYINSPGGSVSAGLAIYDTMNFIKPDVSTVCMGIAASMGAFLLSSGTKGKRICLPNSEVMIHQPLGGASGQATDVQIAAEHIINTKHRLNAILAKNTGQDLNVIQTATERDNWLNAEAARDFGLIDRIIEHH